MINTGKGGFKKFPSIRCPYCFNEFPHNKVCFKARTVFTNQDVESMEDAEIWNLDRISGTEKKPVSREIIEKFIEQEDAEYISFWGKYPNSEPEWKYRNYPVITPESTEMMDAERGYDTDVNGFVISVKDCFGKESKIRICPVCHNELPSSYGKYPVYIIALVGITHSGKTVYLSYLMENFSKIMSWTGMSALKMGDHVDRFIRENKVAKNEFLPQGTPPEQLSQPLFYRIKDEKQTYTLVFYDIAGENCVKSDKMEQYGSFIRNADGIILMIDPEQFFQLRADPYCDVLEPEAVLSAMCEAFLDADHEDGRSDKPLAVVFSKSDILKKRTREITAESNIYDHIEYNKKGFQGSSYRDLNGELRIFLSHLSQGDAILENLKACFTRFAFFAVSVLDGGEEEVECGTDQGEKIVRYKPMNSPSAIRIEEPLFWILNQKGIIPQIDKEQKPKGLIRGLIEKIRRAFT